MAQSTAVLPGVQELTADERDDIHRRNYLLFLADFVLFSLGFNFVGSATVIPDFVRKLTDFEVLIALSSQMFEIGWLMPQLLVARRLVRVANKKWWFIGPNIPVRLLMIIYAAIIVLVGPDHPAVLLGFFLVLYGLSGLGDGLVGVPWIDLIGSSLDNRRRARLFGMGNAIVGVLVLGLAPFIRLVLGDNGPPFPNNYALLFLLAGLMFFVTVPFMFFLRELPAGKPREASPPLSEFLPELGQVLRHDRPFRSMMTARVLMALFTLATPFYIGFATERLDMSSDVAVSQLLMMGTIGSVSGALLYSRFGDRHNLKFIRGAVGAGMLQPVLALLAGVVGPAPLYLVFMAGGFIGGTLGFGFINWVIGYATPDQRPVYSGLFNTVSAVGLLTAPLIGGVIVQVLGFEAVFVTALLIVAAAFVAALRVADPAALAPESDSA